MRRSLSSLVQAAAAVCGLLRQGLRRLCLLSLRTFETGLLDFAGKICCKQKVVVDLL